MRNLIVAILFILFILGGAVVYNCINNNLQTINRIDVERCHKDMQKIPNLLCD